MNVMLLGATGLVGSATLRLLLASDAVDTVIAPGRKALSAHPKLVNVVVGDLLALADMPEPWRGVDAVVCALGTTRKKAGSDAAFRHVDLDIPVALARTALAAGVPAFSYVSSIGADANSSLLYTRTKGEAEVALAAVGFRSLTIVRPGFIAGPRAEKRPVEAAVTLLLRFFGPLLPLSMRASSSESIACALVDHALHPRAGTTWIRAQDLV